MSSATRPSASASTLTSFSGTRLAVEEMYEETAPVAIAATLTGMGVFSSWVLVLASATPPLP